MICNVDQMKVLVPGLEKMTPDDILQVVECFSFDDMIYINKHDRELIGLHMVFLGELSKYKCFYDCVNALDGALSFFLENFEAFEDIKDSDILTNLLSLFKTVLQKIKTNKNLEQSVYTHRKKLIELLTFIVKVRAFQIQHVRDYITILCEIIDWEILCKELSMFFEIIFQQILALGATLELAIFSNCILEKYFLPIGMLNKCVEWILTDGQLKLLTNEKETKLQLLIGINLTWKISRMTDIDVKVGNETLDQILLDNISPNLMNISNDILNWCNDPDLRRECLKLIAFLISKHSPQDNVIILHKLVDLPEAVKDWPNTKSEIFFSICALQFECIGKSYWSTKEIFSTISAIISGKEKYTMNVSVLKLICAIFPFTLRELKDESSLIEGQILLSLLETQMYNLREMLSYNVDQLSWILTYRGKLLKEKAVLSWLHRGDLDILAKAITDCGNSQILYTFLTDEDIDESLFQRLQYVIKNVQDPTLFETIACSLPIYFKENVVFKRLITTNPAITQDDEKNAMLCRFMSTMTLFIKDETTFRAACIYLKTLIVALKSRTDIWHLAVPTNDRIKYFLSKLSCVTEGAAVELLGLLKVILLVQKRHRVEVVEKIYTDLSVHLNGPTEKITKCLDLLQIIITSSRSVIALERSSVKRLAWKLFSLSFQENHSKEALICILEMLKRNQELVLSKATDVFIHMTCISDTVRESWHYFVLLLTDWLKLKKSMRSGIYIHQSEAIMYYLRKVPSLSSNKERKIMKLIHKLHQLPDRMTRLEEAFKYLTK